MIINPSREKSPCLGCTERHERCHSECEKYIHFRAVLDAENEQRYKEKKLYLEANQIEHDRIEAAVNGKFYRSKYRGRKK